MGRIGFLFFVLGLSSVYAQILENFRVSSTDGNNTAALIACFGANLCDSSGCCSGRGVCAYNSTAASTTCACDTAAECIGTKRAYSGNVCQTYSPGDCCTSASGTLAFSLNGGCHTDSQFVSGTTIDPQRGARGQLLKRLGSPNYANGVSTPQSWAKTIDQQWADLNNASRTITLTRGNMLGLGFLEFAVKDVVDYVYDTNPLNNVTLDGVAYPSILKQVNTGQTIGALNIAAQFANNASGAVDLDPLFNYAHRKVLPGNSNYLTPYIDITDALAYWNHTQHMSFEFLVALRYYARYHYYAVRTYEEFLCGQNSQSAAITNTCPIASLFGSLQLLEDWIYEQARRSTIRFSHALLQQSVLQILSDHPAGTDNTSIQAYTSAPQNYDGYAETAWFFWFTRDQFDHYGAKWGSVRTHQEWSSDQTGANFTHFIQTGLDHLISLRNPTYDTAAWALASQDTCGITVSTNALLKDVMTLAHTHLQRFGSQIASQYSADVKIQIYRSYELGLGSYNTHIGYLTNQPVAQLSTDLAFYYGAQVETNSGRQYYATLPSVVLASLVGINNVLVGDFGGYWHRNSTWLLIDADVTDGFTAATWHPEHITPSRAGTNPPDFQYCYDGSLVCSTTETTASNAGLALLGYSFEIDALDADDSLGGMEDTFLWRGSGLTFTAPTLESQGGYWTASNNHIWEPSQSSDPAGPSDHQVRVIEQFRLLPEFLNPLFWQFDGLNTFAAKQNSGHTRYLPNQLVDSIPLNIGWIDPYYDSYIYAGTGGTGPQFGCFDSSVMVPTCTRYNGKVDYTALGTSICTWQEFFAWP